LAAPTSLHRKRKEKKNTEKKNPTPTPENELAIQGTSKRNTRYYLKRFPRVDGVPGAVHVVEIVDRILVAVIWRNKKE
jgi:hypothetical protein